MKGIGCKGLLSRYNRRDRKFVLRTHTGLSPQTTAAAAAAAGGAGTVGRRGCGRAPARQHVRGCVLRLMGTITMTIPLQTKDGGRKTTRGASPAKRKVRSPATVSALPLAVTS